MLLHILITIILCWQKRRFGFLSEMFSPDDQILCYTVKQQTFQPLICILSGQFSFQSYCEYTFRRREHPAI